MVAKVNGINVVDANGVGSTTTVVEVTGDLNTVCAALAVTHTIAGVSGAFVLVQGSEAPSGAGFTVVATFA